MVAARAEGARRGYGPPRALRAQRRGGRPAVRGGDSRTRRGAQRHRRHRFLREHFGGRERGCVRGALDELRVRICADGRIEAKRPARRRFDDRRARILGARALQISMGAPLYVSEEELREAFMHELIQLYGTEEAKVRFVLDPLKIATLEYESDRIPIDIEAADNE